MYSHLERKEVLREEKEVVGREVSSSFASETCGFDFLSPFLQPGLALFPPNYQHLHLHIHSFVFLPLFPSSDVLVQIDNSTRKGGKRRKATCSHPPRLHRFKGGNILLAIIIQLSFKPLSLLLELCLRLHPSGRST